MAGPLSGIKVLDLSRILAGPWASQVLADYGAEVWKIERPEVGDDTRHWGPPFLSDQNGNKSDISAYFLCANRGKKSLAIDITSLEGQAQIHELVKHADIVLENFKVGGLAKYQLDYASLSAIKPDIIYCSITGFGQTGPKAKQAGYDAMIQASGGLMSITGEPGGTPQKVGVAVCDLMTGMYAVSGILAALFHRSQSGEGQHIDLALFDTQVAWLANQASNYLVSGQVPTRLGTAHPNIVPYQAIPVKDGFIMLAVGNDSQFQKCCQVLGCPELASQSEYATNASRVKHREQLIELLISYFAKQGIDYWLEHLAEQHVPCGPINTMDRVFNDEQLTHRQMQFELEHPTLGKVAQVANPVKFSKTSLEYKVAPPSIGSDTQSVLANYGLNKTKS
ncbi:CaiB/BaiF CoA transferase family protein [Colwellia sp. MEBiC06753]